jgi:hypothetical protein
MSGKLRAVGLRDSAIAEPGGVGAIEAFDVCEETVAQGEQHGAGLELVVVLQTMLGLQHLGTHSLVLGAMAKEAWIVRLLHQGLFEGKVHAGEFDEALKERAGLLASASIHEGEAEIVDGVHEDAVLIVDGADIHGAVVVPGKESHISLHKSLKEPSVVTRIV